jgi:hypothetical protein
MCRMKKFLTLCALALVACRLPADEAPFQASLTPEIAIQPRSTRINGFAINIWGENEQHSLNLGFVNGSVGDSAGFTFGLVNYTASYTGIQWGFANYTGRSFVGLQIGDVNVSQGTFQGVQYGYVNYAEEFQGLQLGAVNYAKDLRGVQLGLINVAMNNPWFKEFPDKLATGFPLFNWSF